MRTWSELIDDADDALPLIREWAEDAPFTVDLLERFDNDAQRTLEQLQISTRSPLGAIAFHTGGLLVDDGWLRILGAGCARLARSVTDWNLYQQSQHRIPLVLLVADDALGGFFGWFDDTRAIHYLSPDTFEWENLELGYSDWLQSMLSEDLEGFYVDLRWQGWRGEVGSLGGDQALNVQPPLVFAGPPLVERSRKPVPIEEHWAFVQDVGRQLAELSDGVEVELKVTD